MRLNLGEDLEIIAFLRKYCYIDDKEARFMRSFVEDLLAKQARFPRGDCLFA